MLVLLLARHHRETPRCASNRLLATRCFAPVMAVEEGPAPAAKAQAEWRKHADGHARYNSRGELCRFQRFYSGDRELQSELQKILGPEFRRVPVAPLTSAIAVAALEKR